MTAQAVAGTELFSSYVTLNPGALAHVEVEGNSNGTTDNFKGRGYGTLDASTENPDDFPIFEFTIDCTSGNDSKVSFPLSGIYRWRIGCVRDGSTDTITTDIWYREDGVSL
jgi:hypothetical protein